jgi:hypothetical protein
MNRLHAMTRIQRLVFEHRPVDGKDVFMRVRMEIPNGGDNEVMSRKEIEAFADHAIKLIGDMKFSVELARLQLDIAEGELRADLLDALDALDMTNPSDCRDIYELHREIGNSTGAPSLRKAIDTLAVGGTHEDTIAALTARLLALYPAAEGDNE